VAKKGGKAKTAGIVLGGIALAGIIAWQLFKGPPPEKYKCIPGDLPYPEYLEDAGSVLYNILSGVAIPMYGKTDRSDAFAFVAEMDENAIRCLNNYWIKNLDSECSLYTWIEDEIVFEFSLEQDNKNLALGALLAAGINPEKGDCWF